MVEGMKEMAIKMTFVAWEFSPSVGEYPISSLLHPRGGEEWNWEGGMRGPFIDQFLSTPILSLPFSPPSLFWARGVKSEGGGGARSGN